MTSEAPRNKVRAKQRACYRSKTPFELLPGLTGSVDRNLAHKTGQGVENAGRMRKPLARGHPGSPSGTNSVFAWTLRRERWFGCQTNAFWDIFSFVLIENMVKRIFSRVYCWFVGVGWVVVILSNLRKGQMCVISAILVEFLNAAISNLNGRVTLQLKWSYSSNAAYSDDFARCSPTTDG